MARSQGRTDFICETLLTASSNARSSLEALQTSGLIEGASAFVVDKNASYILRPDSEAPPDGDKVIAALGGGNWVENQAGGGAGTDPVEVRSLADLPAPVAGVITLLDDTRYEIIGLVDISPNLIQAGDDNVIVGRAGILFSSTFGVLITAPSTSSLTLERLTLDSSTGSFLIESKGSADLTLRDCRFEGASTAGINGESPLSGGTWTLINCEGSATIGRLVTLTSGTLDKLSLQGCVLRSNIGLQVGATVTLGEWYVEGSSFDSANSIAIGITIDAGATIGFAQASSNDFSGLTDTGAQSYNEAAAQAFSPVEVRSPPDLGEETSATIRTLFPNVVYEIIGVVDVGARSVVFASDVTVRGRGGTLRSATTAPFLSFTSGNTGELAVEDVTVELTSASGIGLATNSAPANVTVRNAVFLGGLRCIDGIGSGRLTLLGCRFKPDVGIAVEPSAGWTDIVVANCIFEDRDGINIDGAITNISIVGNAFDMPGGETGITDGDVTAGSIVGNIFTGAGTPTSGVTAPNGWVARGNIGVADF